MVREKQREAAKAKRARVAAILAGGALAHGRPIEETTKAKKAGRPIAQTTPMKIALAAVLELAGLKPYAMTDQLCPESLYPRKTGETEARCRRRRFEATRYFLRKYRGRIDLEKKRREDPKAA